VVPHHDARRELDARSDVGERADRDVVGQLRAGIDDGVRMHARQAR
jgi:hypothetical protein